ncbi:DUF72 domain-containing protein [Salegentibacter sp. F188]|uniref:DUF72 domain-containing protein n=1 Tax=Autumnicola patrickiae TaxID=3075591 RepID=A0ABU3E2X8_9FLAO|nr:DUF72 domain-containing protein [Salegentibacter sp. F188]MDT0690285.1 DUF72 domain-containing protein [Salegentibacter sp. F188]
MKSNIQIGTSGYQYKHWKGDFYPKDLAVKDRFEFYARHFDTVEINNTFYKMADASTFDEWKNSAPKDFCYAIKYSRFGTHRKKLKDPEGHVNYFLDRATHLETLLGPVLVQLPPNWKKNIERLKEFLQVTPKSIRWAIEIRDPDWLSEELYELLREHNAALVLHDMIPDHPRVITADWTYMRFHGKNYSGNYSKKHLNEIADEVRGYVDDGLDVFVYFNNDLEGHAVRNALSLKENLGV